MKRFDEMTWKEKKLYYLKARYGRHIEKCVGYKDDRGLYRVIYEKMIEAIESLPDEPNNYVCVAMNKAIEKDISDLDDIIQHFWK